MEKTTALHLEIAESIRQVCKTVLMQRASRQREDADREQLA